MLHLLCSSFRDEKGKKITSFKENNNLSNNVTILLVNVTFVRLEIKVQQLDSI
jgi:hypothetical protein